MKKFFTSIIIAIFAITSFATTETSDFFKDAQAKAKKENKMIMLVFSGVQWCPPCQMYDKYILKSSQFKSFAKSKLILIDIDMKRNREITVSVDGKEIKPEKKESFDKTISELNQKYPHRGVPYSVIIDDKGAIVFEQMGFPRKKPNQFVQNIKKKITPKKK